MSLADWDFYYNNVVYAGLETASPITGVSSYKIVANGNPSLCTMVRKSTYDNGRGYLGGRIRALFKVALWSSNSVIGFYCLGRSDDMTDIVTAENIYYRFIIRSTGFLLQRVTGVASSSASSGVITLNSDLTAPSLNTVYAMELEWDYSQSRNNGIQLYGRYGTATDFSGMSELHGYDDVNAAAGFNTLVSTPYPVNARSEGVLVGGQDAAPASPSVIFDSISLWKKNS